MGVIAVLLLVGLAALALGFTDTFSVGWSDGSANNVSVSHNLTGSLKVGIKLTAANGNALAAGAVDQRVQEGFDVAAVKGVLITVQNNTGTVTIKTNSTSTPVHTFTFASGGGSVFWTNKTASEWENPFTDQSATDVTDFYLSNAGGAAADVEIRILY